MKVVTRAKTGTRLQSLRVVTSVPHSLSSNGCNRMICCWLIVLRCWMIGVLCHHRLIAPTTNWWHSLVHADRDRQELLAQISVVIGCRQRSARTSHCGQHNRLKQYTVVQCWWSSVQSDSTKDSLCSMISRWQLKQTIVPQCSMTDQWCKSVHVLFSLATEKPKIFAECPFFHDLSKLAKITGRKYSISNTVLLVVQLTKTPKLRTPN